jgi:hypothetical protein
LLLYLELYLCFYFLCAQDFAFSDIFGAPTAVDVSPQEEPSNTVAFSDIFGAPTAVDVSPQEEPSNTVAGRLVRRVSGLVRRASAAVLSATGPIIRSRSSLGGGLQAPPFCPG